MLYRWYTEIPEGLLYQVRLVMGLDQHGDVTRCEAAPPIPVDNLSASVQQAGDLCGQGPDNGPAGLPLFDGHRLVFSWIDPELQRLLHSLSVH
jgi:hypothetical protein